MSEGCEYRYGPSSDPLRGQPVEHEGRVIQGRKEMKGSTAIAQQLADILMHHISIWDMFGEQPRKHEIVASSDFRAADIGADLLVSLWCQIQFVLRHVQDRVVDPKLVNLVELEQRSTTTAELTDGCVVVGNDDLTAVLFKVRGGVAGT